MSDHSPALARITTSRLRSWQLQIVGGMLPFAIAAVTSAVLVLRGFAGLRVDDLAHGRAHLAATYVGGAIAMNVLAVVVAVIGSRELARRQASLVRTVRNCSAGELHPDEDLIVHEFDDVGRTAQQLVVMLNELRRIAHQADRIAGGDLTVEITPRSGRDEIRLALAEMVTSLRSAVGAIDAAADRVSTLSDRVAADTVRGHEAVQGIAGSIGEVAAGAERQVRAIEDVGARTTAISDATVQAATDAQEAAEHGQEARSGAEKGVGEMIATAAAMAEIRARSEEATETITALGELSSRIADMVETIGEIAEQTNLLALNAAIEAARAGERGRGFAVVADEVRPLAGETQSAAQAIAGLVDEIGAETERAIDVVEDGARRTAEGAGTVDAAQRTFGAIAAAVETTGAHVADIATAVGAMASETARMEGVIAEVASIADESSAAAAQVSASAKQTAMLTDEIAAGAARAARSAEELREIAARFRLR